jgi:hypothetical protein
VFKNLTVIIFTLLATGCASLAQNYLPDEIMIHGEDILSPYMNKDNQINLSKIAAEKVEGSSNQLERNNIISKMISLSDQKCVIHKAGIISNSSAWNVGTGGTALLFAGAASVATSVNTASNLGAAAAATLGIKSLVNEEVYADAMATTLLRAIDVQRVKAKAPIEKGILNGNYRFSQAVIDIQNYHHACSLMAGLVEITKSLDNRLQSRQELQRDIASLKISLSEVSTVNAGVSSSLMTSIRDGFARKIAQKQLELSSRKE